LVEWRELDCILLNIRKTDAVMRQGLKGC